MPEEHQEHRLPPDEDYRQRCLSLLMEAAIGIADAADPDDPKGWSLRVTDIMADAMVDLEELAGDDPDQVAAMNGAMIVALHAVAISATRHIDISASELLREAKAFLMTQSIRLAHRREDEQ